LRWWDEPDRPAIGFTKWWPAGDARTLAERLLDLTDKVKRAIR